MDFSDVAENGWKLESLLFSRVEIYWGVFGGLEVLKILKVPSDLRIFSNSPENLFQPYDVIKGKLQGIHPSSISKIHK
jgi:hypothetical protein